MIAFPRRSWAGVLACCSLIGCGGDGPDIVSQRGKLLNGGQPVTATQTEVLQLEFYNLADLQAGKSVVEPWDAVVEDDGSFVVAPDRGGLPEGKYRVVIHLWAPFPDKDKFNKRFSRKNSPIEMEVGQGEIVIDVAKFMPKEDARPKGR